MNSPAPPDSRSRPELVRVRAPREGWPNQQGTWGTVLAVPPSRRERLRKLGLGADGLPLGIQVVAPRKQDHLSIAVAMTLEDALGGWRPPSRFA